MDDIRAVMDTARSGASRARGHRGRVRAGGDVRGHVPRANAGADRLVGVGTEPVGCRLPVGGVGGGLGRGDAGRRATMGDDRVRERMVDVRLPRTSRTTTRRHPSTGSPSWMRATGGPGDAVALYDVDRWIPISATCCRSSASPRLIVHRTEDRTMSIEHGRYVAEHIAGAELRRACSGEMHWMGREPRPPRRGSERFVGEIQREDAEFDRVLATVLFTDIVGSTETGRRAGRSTLAGSRGAASRVSCVGCWPAIGASEDDTAGDGFYATFDGPARAVRCARARSRPLKPLGIEGRAGVHTRRGAKRSTARYGGLAVNDRGARVGRALPDPRKSSSRRR